MEGSVSELLRLIENDRGLIDAQDRCERQVSHLNVSGMCEQNKGFLAASLSARKSKLPVIIVPDPARARVFADYIAPFVDGRTVILSPAEMSLVSAVARSRENDSDRAGEISLISSGRFGAAIICASALTNRMISPREWNGFVLHLRTGDRYEPADLITALTGMGYERTGTVSVPGEFSSRGDVIDIYPPDMGKPVRLSFFDDEIDRIATFDPETQRSEDQFTKTEIFPAVEYLWKKEKRGSLAQKIRLSGAGDINAMNASSRTGVGELLNRTVKADAEAMETGSPISGIARWLPIIYDEPSSILDYINTNTCMVFIDEIMECRSRMDAYAADYMARCKNAFETGTAPKCAFESLLPSPEAFKRLDKIGCVTTLSCLPSSGNGLPGGITVKASSASAENWRGRDRELASYVKNKEYKSTVRFLITGTQRTEALRLRLAGEGIAPQIVGRALPSGFDYPGAGLILIGEQDVFGSEKKMSSPKKKTGRLNFFGDVKPGDYVVHDVHGIGQYEGTVNMRMGKSCQDYLKINYAKNAVIYVPVDKLDKLQKYVGPGGKQPKLSSLDSGEWTKAVERARSSIKKLAFDLVKLYAVRRSGKGFSCEPDNEWQKMFEENFPYVETDDQLSAIRDIKKDMESDVPMDRLLCGDVGFGKTEVAFRAMFKCVQNGKQAFMLAPTTLLAQQHYDNFISRVRGFPVKVALLSRFVPPSKIRQSLKEIKDGSVDVVIGTHRILSKDVIPHDLGLLVVDEEQRFGVNHKEQIKAMRSNIDVLTLTATPIPRTLHMSMSGIRDISVLDEAPMNRRPVETYVLEYDEEIVVQACMREISRGGQVFYLYNKTADIDEKASYLGSLMPGVRVVYAHGKMSEHQMEKIVESFILGEADILVCTTIIESGVDMPNVNTMIVEDSDRFGLSQLYQIKGRVGRSDRQAYAYITYDPEKSMNSDAQKRLMAIREFTELGSGVKVALRDLEVRGAGNLLGAEQHGQMEVIGYELYCRLLDEEIKLLKDEGDTSYLPKPQVNLEIDFDSYIPSKYIDDEAIRMSIYRRIGKISSRPDYDDFLDEVTDRYGDPPKEVVFLAGAALVKALASDAGFERVCFRDAGVLLYFANDRKMDQEAVGRLLKTPRFAGKIMICAQGKPYIHYKPTSLSHEKTVGEVTDLFDVLLNTPEAPSGSAKADGSDEK
ncbi:MAG: transcription-repair coupling factor [Clostridiales bacterium]|nr:transcription-repair coupling factor [Clostridiales bacterium]